MQLSTKSATILQDITSEGMFAGPARSIEDRLVHKDIKVLILCRNRLLRESVARLLAKRDDFDVVTPQSIGTESCVPFEPAAADVFVADSLQPLVERWPCVPAKDSKGSSIKCVLIAMQDEPSQFLAAVKYGALGYVLQEASADDIVAAVRVVAQGEAICPPAFTRLLFEYIAMRTADLPDKWTRTRTGLTRREQQLVPLIGKGLTNKEIANQLNLSEQTIKNHIHRILRKVGVGDRLSVFEACQAQALLPQPRLASQPYEE